VALLLLLGLAVGGGAAWWQRAGEPAVAAQPPAPSSPPAGLAAPAEPATARDAAGGASPSASLAQMDRSELLAGRVAPGEWRLARLRGNPQVLVLQFPGLAEQGAAMNRAAAFVEKAQAPRDRVLGDAELATLIARQGDNAQTFYLGHDYLAEQLARFFSVAAAQRQRLNAHEQRLLQLLLDKRVIARKGESFDALGLQAIVTFTGTQPDDKATPQDERVDDRRRESVLLHELSHGLYFTSAAYREHCAQFWRQRLTADERKRFRELLGRMNYDLGNEDLLINEMQALLMHTPDTRAFGGASLGLGEAQLAELRARFRVGMVALR
jgi:hypothetical protein